VELESVNFRRLHSASIQMQRFVTNNFFFMFSDKLWWCFSYTCNVSWSLDVPVSWG